MLNAKDKKSNFDFRYIFFLTILSIAILVFYGVGVWTTQICKVFKITEWFTYHIILEIISIIICFIVFTINYYTFGKENRIRRLIFFNTFFMVGCLNFFHIIIYMETSVFCRDVFKFYVENFWILSRFILALGLLSCGLIHYKKTVNWNRLYFLLGNIGFTITIFYLITNNTYSFTFFSAQVTKTKMLLEYSMLVMFGFAAILYMKDYHFTKEKSFLIIAMGLVFSVLAEVAIIIRQWECYSYNLIGHTYRLIGLFLIFRGIFVFNLDHPYAQLNKARNQLKLYAENLEKVIERRTSEIRKVNQKMFEDLQYAKRIQETLLPPEQMVINGVKFISEYIPCESLSGDFYQIHSIDDNYIGMYIADVSGHGVSAAMMTVFTDRMLTPVDEQYKWDSKPSPAKTLVRFYQKFNAWDFPKEMYIVIFKAIYNKETKVLSYCSGGMNVEPILVRKDGSTEILNKSEGFPICKLGDFYVPEFKNAEVKLESGDRIIFYTDGLVENFKNDTLIKRSQLMHLLQDNRKDSLNNVSQKIIKEIFKDSKEIKYDDDITYFIMEV